MTISIIGTCQNIRDNYKIWDYPEMPPPSLMRKMANWLSDIIATQSATVTDMQAKAAVYQFTQSEELAGSIAADLVGYNPSPRG